MKKRTDEQGDRREVRGLNSPEIVAFNKPQLLLGLTEGSELLGATPRPEDPERERELVHSVLQSA